MKTFEMFARGWRVFVPVVLANATIQAATTLPMLTPTTSTGFVALVAASVLALMAGTVLIGAQVASPTGGFHRPTLALLIAGVLTPVLIGASAILWSPSVLITATLALVALPSLGGHTAVGAAGFAVFIARPLRAVLLALITVVSLALLWVGALLSGFFITGAVSALVTWLVIGPAAVILVCAWNSLQAEGSPAT